MKISTFTKLGRTFWLVAGLAVGVIGWLGCGGDDNPTDGGGGGVSGGPLNYGGQTYRTVIIGGKRWMAENLNVTTANSWCNDNNSSNCNKYGRLYTWSAALTACPDGWRLPSRDDWNQLAEAVGGERKVSSKDSTIFWVGGAEKALKSKSGWGSDGNGNNTYGFSALPGGSGYENRFISVGSMGFWWESEERSDSEAYCRYMTSGYEYVGEIYTDKKEANSVRCIAE